MVELTDTVWVSTDASVILFTENQVDLYLKALDAKPHEGIVFHKIKFEQKHTKIEIINSFRVLKKLVRLDD